MADPVLEIILGLIFTMSPSSKGGFVLSLIFSFKLILYFFNVALPFLLILMSSILPLFDFQSLGPPAA